MLPAPGGALDIVLAVPDGGLFLHLDPAGTTTKRAIIPYLPGGVLPSIAREGPREPVLAWNTWEQGTKGRIVAARITDIGAEAVFITSQTMAISDPSLAMEQSGEAILFWEDARLGTDEAFFSTIRPDIWDAYPPNLRLPDSGADPGRPAVSVDPGNRILAAWAADDRIMGARAFSYGFGLSAERATVHPHGVSGVQVMLLNTGGMADTVRLALDLSGLPLGWNAALTADEATIPASDEAVAVRIVLFGPQSETGPRHGSLRLLATSSGNALLQEEIVIPVDMDVDYRTTASLAPPMARAPPGGSASFDMGIRNSGDAPEKLALVAQSAQGLSVLLGQTGLQIDWNADIRVPVTVSIPREARQGDYLQFTVTVSSSTTGVAQTLLGTVVVLPGVQIWMSAPVDRQNIASGSNVSFSMLVGNAGNSEGPAVVGLEIVSGMDGWTASIDRPRLTLAAGESAWVSLAVGAPEGANGRFVVRVVAAAAGWDSWSSMTFSAAADPVHGLQAYASQSLLAAAPGGEGLAQVFVANRGSSLEEVSVEISLPSGWVGETRIDGGVLSGPLAIRPGETARLVAAVMPPSDAPAGIADAAVVFTTRTGAFARATFNVSIAQLYEPAIQTPTPVIRAEPGEPAVAVLTVRNMGNGQDIMRLETEAPPGWTARLADLEQAPVEQLSISAGGSSTVILQVWAPFLSSDAWSDLTVAATSQSGLRARLSLRVALLLSDISLSVSYSPRPFTAGRTVLATVTVANTGEAPARNVVVAFNVDGKGERLERILLLPPGSEKTATFSWTPVAGSHLLRFEADPVHLVLERDEGNNIFLEKISIPGSIPVAPGLPPAALAAGSATIILGALGVAAGGTEGGKYWLAGLLFVPLYTKIKKDDVLDHFVRGQVYGYIKANPGEHYNSIKKALSLKNGTLIYHLKTLENSEFIKSVLDGRFRRFYPKEMRLPEPSDEIVLRMNHIQHDMLGIIRANPGISQKEIAAKIGLSTPTVHYHINIMMSARAIVVRRFGRETRCYVEDIPDGKAG
jgi:uncharacterized membrane protein